MCPRTDTHLTYVIDIALTTDFSLALAVRDERRGPDHQVVDCGCRARRGGGGRGGVL